MVLVTVTAYGKEHGDGGVDEQEVEGTVTEVLLVLGTERTEGVVGFPIRGDVRREQLFQLFYRLTFQEFAESRLALIV